VREALYGMVSRGLYDPRLAVDRAENSWITHFIRGLVKARKIASARR